MQSSDQWIWSLAESALAGTLSPEAQAELSARIATDGDFARQYEDCLSLLRSLDDAGRQRRFKGVLADVHAEHAVKEAPAKKVVPFFPKYLRTAGMAAGIALATSLTTIWAVRHGEPKPASRETITLLNGKINGIQSSLKQQQYQINTIIAQQTTDTPRQAAAYYSGTGTAFALTNDGYLITSYHVTDGADSLYVRTRNGDTHRARVVAFEPTADIAVLKIEDKAFRFGKGDVPYTFAPAKAPLGARIYTLGFPQDEIVYNEGYISATNGYEGDSLQYRLEVAAGAGESGSPVLDNAGNLIGIIKGKDTQAEGTTYAVSSKTLLGLLHDLPRQQSLHLPKVNRMSSLSHEQQIDKLQDYTCLVQVYKK